MAKVEVKNLEAEIIEQLEVTPDVFEIPRKDSLIHQAYSVSYANQRQVLAHTKNRGERAGSGKKPWKQKGTGRARVGSVRSPIWKKGGVVFGPTKDRNFEKKINKKMNSLAIKMVLSGKLSDKELVVIQAYELKEKKTKVMQIALNNLQLKGKILMAFAKTEKEMMQYSRNIPKVKNITVDKLNVFDMLNNKYLLLSKDSIKYLEEKYSDKK